MIILGRLTGAIWGHPWRMIGLIGAGALGLVAALAAATDTCNTNRDHGYAIVSLHGYDGSINGE
ncbi:hypothetical protein EPO04_02255 [Patescibacteria group bacterium]|nr:MAG: hypothetical protein EPO04_02255 [Patescibacteria group bacterium]